MAAYLLVPGVFGALGDATMLSEEVDSGASSNEQLIIATTPIDYGQMVEEIALNEGLDTQMPDSGLNKLWVVDDTGEMNDSMGVPLGGYVRVFITPNQGGNVVVEQLSPDNQVQAYDMGVVEPFHTYRIWFNGNVAGIHQMRYNVNGEYSNVIEFYVS